jgi:AcrR family transcriptional regulator
VEAEGTAGQRVRSGSRRDEVARLAVLHAADDLLAERGFRSLTIEAIARAAGVSKQTIYRWWPSKVEILLDTLVTDVEKRVPVPTEQVGALTVRTYFRALNRLVARDPAGRVLLALLAEAQQNPEAAAAFELRFLRPRRTRERTMVTLGVRQGELAPRLGTDAALDAVSGFITFRALTGVTTPRALVDAVTADAFGFADRSSPLG